MSKRCFGGLIAALISVGFVGVATAQSPNSKCTPAMQFTFAPGTTVPEGTLVTMTQDITVAIVGSGSQDCGVAVGEHVDDGNAQIQQITLGPGGEPKACGDIGKSYCTVGTSINVDGTCTSNAQCVTDPVGTGVCTAVTTTQLAHANPTNGVLAVTNFDTASYGGQSLGFQASYQGQANYSNAPSICTDLTVTTEVCSGATISIDLVDGNGSPAPGGPYEWTYEVTVRACENLTDVTAQGGTNGWAPLKGRSAANLFPDTGTAEIRNANKKSEVILWTIGDMAAGDTARLGVLLSGSIPRNAPDCQTRYLSGPWSALSSTDGVVTKTPYTGRVTVQVDSDGNPNDCGP
jgi:hypothetical protein